MINLSEQTEALAIRLAEAQSVSVDAAIRRALEQQTTVASLAKEPVRQTHRRMSIEEMLAVGDEIAAMPLLDQRSPREILDELNDL
jgi:antitoxin VapB